VDVYTHTRTYARTCWYTLAHTCVCSDLVRAGADLDLNAWIHAPEPEPEVARSSVADFDFDLGTSTATQRVMEKRKERGRLN
jgi:hypothetical protein